MLPLSQKNIKTLTSDYMKTALREPLDTTILLTFFDAVVIVIATCSYRDGNMMLST